MVKRPDASEQWKKNIFEKRSTFNRALESALYKKKGYINNFILSIEVELNDFLHGGYLSGPGKQKFWHELDPCIQKFECREINLKPKNNGKKDKSSRKTLPKPPRLNSFRDSTRRH